MRCDYTLQLSLDQISSFTQEFLEKLESEGISQQFLFDIRLSLEEALINAVKHGNKLDARKRVFFKAALKDPVLEIEIQDEGNGFDYENIPIPTDPENVKKISGRGIFLMRQYMNEVHFLEGGRKIRMLKNVS